MADINNYPIWPGWETVRLIGRGSFGAVYEIQRDVFGHAEKAALKVITIPQSESDIDDLRSDGYDEASITTRFEGYLQDIVREYSMMADMKGCANIVYCDDVRYIQHDNGIGWDIFIKMELLTALPKMLEKTVPEKQVVKIGMDICSALAFCEKRNILHRDIKPQNIFAAPDGTYKLGDFGIAKTAERTTGGTKTGTYKYMAPEVYNNQPYGGKADIYSLGLVLYWLLNERRTPFLPLNVMPSTSDEDKARARRFSGETLPAPKNGSEELKRIVLKACAYDVKDRYQNAGEMLANLEALGGTKSSSTPTQTPVENDGEKTVGAWSLPQKSLSAPEEEEKTVGVWDKPAEKAPAKPAKKSKLSLVAAIGGILLVALIAVLIGRNLAPEESPAPTESPAPVETPAPTESPAPVETPAPTESPAPVKNYMRSFDWCEDIPYEELSKTGFWGQSDHLRDEVVHVFFVGTLKNEGASSWDISENQDGSVKAWFDEGDLYVGANKEIICSYPGDLFDGFINLERINFESFSTTGATSMRGMFKNCTSLTTLDFFDVDTSSVTDMSWMFSGCSSLTSLDISGFDMSKVTDMSYMLNECSSLTSVDVSGLNTSNVTDMNHIFYKCASLATVDVSSLDTSKMTDMNHMFYGCSSLTAIDVSGFDTSKVTNMECMFYECKSLTDIDVSGFDTSKVTNMGFMFAYCVSLTTADVSGFDTSKVTDMAGMFCNWGYGLGLPSTIDVSGFDTSNVTDMSHMFSGCTGVAALDVSGFDTSKVTSMKAMFQECISLTSVDVSGFDTSNVTDMSYMFNACVSLPTIDVSGFDTSKVTNMHAMFFNCNSLTDIDVSSFDMSNVTDMHAMFNYA